MTVNTILIIITVLVFFGLIGFFIHSISHAPFLNEDEMPTAHPPQDWKPFCSDLPITTEEWKRRFKARIVARLVNASSSAKMLTADGITYRSSPLWDQAEAEAAAESELLSVEFGEIYIGFENDPEASADESLSYWGDGA